MVLQQTHRETANRLASELTSRGLIEAQARWTPLAGGRTNYLWRVDQDHAPCFVVKLYPYNRQTPLFRNDGVAEAAVLTRLSGHGLSADLHLSTVSDQGPCVIYHYVDGVPWAGRPSAVSRLLSRLHGLQIDISLPFAPTGSDELRAQTGEILSACDRNSAEKLSRYMPQTDVPASAQRCLLHGDVVANNILQTGKDTRLIDWQCPMLGEPAADIAIFLSPAMQSLYGGRAPTALFIKHFFEIYGSDEVERRYCDLAPWYHWRMAAYCLWKSERGAHDYRDAMDLELSALEALL